MNSNRIDYDALHKKLESEGKLNEMTTPMKLDNLKTIDENYVFVSDNIFRKAFLAIISGILYVFSPIVTFFSHRLKAEGAENLKLVKDCGAISVSNHVHYLDNLMIRRVVSRYKKMYFTVGPQNCKKGLKGEILRAGSVIPIPITHPNALKNFNKAIHTLMERKNVVHFYPEQSMWLEYEKPRPFMKGAFQYASKENVPVIPMFITFKPRKHSKRKQATLHVLPPIFPKEEFSRGQNINYLKEETEKAILNKYREVYGDYRENIYDINNCAE